MMVRQLAACMVLVLSTYLVAQQNGNWLVTRTQGQRRAVVVSKSNPAVSLVLEAQFYRVDEDDPRFDEDHPGLGYFLLSVSVTNAEAMATTDPDDNDPRVKPDAFRVETTPAVERYHGTDIYTHDPNQMREGVSFDMSFDGGKPITERWLSLPPSTAADRFNKTRGARIVPRIDVAIFPVSETTNPKEFTKLMFLRRLQESKSLRLSYLTRAGEQRSVSFDVSGADAVMASICPPKGCRVTQ